MNEEEQAKLKKMLGNPLFFPQEFKSWLSDYIAVNIPKLPLSHVYGFKLENVRHDSVTGQGTASSTAYGDLDDQTGPSLENIADGFYLVLFGLYRPIQSSPDSFMALSVNGSTPSDNDAVAFVGITGTCTAGRAVIVEARSDQANSIVAKYRVASAGNVNLSRRWIIALKVIEHE